MTDRIDVTIVGVAALLMHSGTLADPLNPIARQLARLASRKKKTEADLERIADLEFTGGLWLEGGRPCIRGDAIEAALCQSAARRRAKAIYRGAVVVRGNPRLEYDGPKTVDGLRQDERFRFRTPVALNGRRLIRTRPAFSCWSAEVSIEYLASFVAREDLIDVLVAAGDTIGIGDHRPRYGRFAVTVNGPAT